MGKLGAFTINFNNAERVIRAGEVLTGFVYVHLRENMKMRGISINFKGKGLVEFSKRRGKTTRYYKSKEDYFDETYSLFKPEGGSDYLQQGEHRFDFQYQLPPFLPCTFEHDIGYVRYCVRSVIDRPWKFDHIAKEAFTVIGLVDLNLEQGVEFPQHIEDEKNSYDCCCRKDGEGSLKMDIPRTGYVPGESVPITAQVVNGVPEIVNFTVELIQYLTFYAKSEKKEARNIIAEFENVKMERNTSFNYNSELLHIPAIPPSRLDGCQSIDVQYSLKLKATTGWFELKAKCPITIGTIPLRSVVDAYRTPPMPDLNAISLEPSAPMPSPPESFPVAPPSSGDFEIPPPSYAECVFGNRNIRDADDTEYTFGAASYAPKYTYYTWT